MWNNFKYSNINIKNGDNIMFFISNNQFVRYGTAHKTIGLKGKTRTKKGYVYPQKS